MVLAHLVRRRSDLRQCDLLRGSLYLGDYRSAGTPRKEPRRCHEPAGELSLQVKVFKGELHTIYSSRSYLNPASSSGKDRLDLLKLVGVASDEYCIILARRKNLSSPNDTTILIPVLSIVLL
jgi:hypothetical protein